MLFFPIIPGTEDASWRELYETGIDRFRAGRFAGAYQADLLARYYAALDNHS
jgi:hypothetical protein